jgi:predicted  nucleic acid-binding Zn-ribbon protein
MVLRNDGIATAEKELRALHEREERLKELLEAARREHNEAVADRHRAADSDEAALTGVNMQIAVLRGKFDELADALADATTQRETAERHYEQLIQAGSTAFVADIDQRVGAIQDALASFRSASQDLANKLTRSTHVGADLTSSVFKTADVLDHEVHGVIGALETAKSEILSGASSTHDVIESLEV